MKNNELSSQFYLNPGITFLNFGSFGATPKPIMEDLWKWQLEMERDPVHFIASRSLDYLKNSRAELAAYIGCTADDLVLMPNPSYALNMIIKGLKLEEGDEVLTTNLEYGALDKTWNYYCKKNKARYVRQHIDLPLINKEKFCEDFWKGYSDKTKIVFLSHITSSTALIFPVKEICEEAKKRGLLTIVDGAHVPGHISLDISNIKTDVYTGACHKWMMTPKGCTFLYVRPELQEMFDPLVVSWGYKSAYPSHSKFLDWHQMQGTRDFCAFLTIPASLKFMRDNNWMEVSKQCRQLAHANYTQFCDLLGTKALAPVTDEFLGQMCSMNIKTREPEKLKSILFEKYKVEIPVMPHGDKVYIRYSINAFNDQKDLDALFDALSDLKKNGLIE